MKKLLHAILCISCIMPSLLRAQETSSLSH